MTDGVSYFPKTKETVEALWRLQKIILDTLDFNQVVQRIVDGLLSELGYLQLGYRIVVLTLVDKEAGILKRISLSQTDEAVRAVTPSPVPFKEIDIPLSADENLLVRTLKEKRPSITHDWATILTPILTPEEARRSQLAAGIKTSMIYPVIVREDVIGVLIFSLIKDESEVSDVEKDLIRGFTDVVGLAVQNSRLYSRLEKTTSLLQSANIELEELDRKKDEFVSLASHELRTPLAGIKSYILMALDGRGGELNEKQRYYLDRSYVSTERLIRLVNNMLNISRIESGRVTIDVKETDIRKLIDEVISEVKPKADESGIRLVYKKADDLPSVIADQDKIKEVLINFIGNSLKFTPKGGAITVSSRVEDQMVLTEVSDTGQGIESDDLQRLFIKFGLIGSSYTTNQAAAQGTGLGLYISKSIVELHQGKVWATSPGKGSGATFGFSLPIFDPIKLAEIKVKQHGKGGIGIIPSGV